MTLPSGDVRIAPCSTPAPEVEQIAAALAGNPARIGTGILRLAELGPVVVGATTDHAGDMRLTLTLHRRDPGGRSWSYLVAVRPDLPRDLPAPWCVVRPAAGSFLMRLLPLLMAEGSAMD